MRISWLCLGVLLCCGTAHAGEPVLGLKGQLYDEDVGARTAPQPVVPRHIAPKHVARAPIDFSYPETAAAPGAPSLSPQSDQSEAVSAWNLDLSDGAKLRFAYDKDTKLSLGMGMWKVKLGVSRTIGGSGGSDIEWPERHGSAAGMGRVEARAPHGPSN